MIPSSKAVIPGSKAVIPGSIRDPWIADQVRNDSPGGNDSTGAMTASDSAA